MDGLSVAASVVAFVQLADSVIRLCKFYIESAKDAPHSLRLILIEISSLRCALKSLDYLLNVDPESLPTAVLDLWRPGGTAEACKESLAQLQRLLPAAPADKPANGNKRRKITQALAWPLKEEKARKLLQEVSQHKDNINLALTIDLRYDSPKEKRKREKSPILFVYALYQFACTG